MSTLKRKSLLAALSLALAGLMVGPAAAAEASSVMLEKGVFAEETTGDLAAAMKIYRQIIADSAAARAYVAEAQCRLGICLEKSGRRDEARVELTKVLSDYPEQKAARTARRRLAGLVPAGLAPMVVTSVPEAFDNCVPANLKAMKVTFNRTMTDKCWSWTQRFEGMFPQIKGDVSYDRARRTCRMPVKLEPGKVYWVGVNHAPYLSFKSTDGKPAVRYVILFATAGRDGKPTPIPVGMIEKAKQINARSFPGKDGVSAGERPLKLLPAPWADGEEIQLDIKSQTGLALGTNIFAARSVKSAGKDAWRVESYVVVPMSNMLQFTRVDAERDTFAPISALTRSTLTGEFRAEYSPTAVKWSVQTANKKESKTVELGRVFYDNEQAIQLIRRLPLKQGYKARFPIFPVQSGISSTCRIVVSRKEKITVPAGEFECYRIDLNAEFGGGNVHQQLWFSADRHKYPVKIDVQGAVIELARTMVRKAPPATTFRDDKLGISLGIPAGWRWYNDPAPTRQRSMLYLLDPELKFWAVLAAGAAAPGGMSARDVAEADVQTLVKFFKNYTVRPKSWVESKVSSLDAATFQADYDDQGRAMVEYRTYIAGDVVYWFVFRVSKDEFPAAKEVLDRIVAGFKAKSAPRSAARPTSESQKLAAKAWRLWGQRKLAEAEKLFARAVEKDPANANAWNGLGWARQNQGKLSPAKKAFEKCLSINSSQPGALNGLGWIAKTQGSSKEAIEHWEKAVAADPRATAAVRGLAITHTELKQYDKAAEYYRMWLKLAPDNAEAKAGLKEVEAAAK